MMELEDCRQQLTYILEDTRAICSVALMADEEHDWDSEGDVVRLIALAVKPIMDRLKEVISELNVVISEYTMRDTDVTAG